LKYFFYIEEAQMAGIYVKKCLTTLAIRNSNQSCIYIQSLLSRMAIIKKRKTINAGKNRAGRGTLKYSWWEC
jgi:hypothetical protein